MVAALLHCSIMTTVPARAQRTAASKPAPAGLRALKAVGRKHSVSMRSHKQMAMAVSTDEQARQMSEAEQRWQQNVRSGRVKSVSSRELADMVKSGEWKVLDVRPVEEVENGYQKGSVHVPLFMVDDDMSVSGLLKQMSAFGMGGWWLGGQHMKPNDQFMPEVLSKMQPDTKVIVTCQKGLRSLAACERLSRAGFESIAWLNGGYEAAEKDIIMSSDESQDIRLAGVGGLSGAIGWNPVQQKEGVSTMDGPFGNVIRIVGFLLAIDGAAVLYEISQAGPQ